jgi:glycosyltransferase involved in cell wall biosynthesis
MLLMLPHFRKMDIFYFKTSNAGFILTDQKILEKHFSVKPYPINNRNGISYIISLIKMTLFLLLNGKKAAIYFIRFADWHTALLTLFKKLYRKKLVIVVGGFDAFHLPEYAYGVYHRKFRGWCAKYSLRNATLILPNSPCLIENTNTYASSRPISGGIKHFVPTIKGEIKVVYNGFDTNFWTTDNTIEKKNIVITVARVNTLRNFYLKGVDSFIELASRLPAYKFRIIGLNREFLSKNSISVPDNLDVIEFLPPHELLKFYQEAKVFCLLSLTEGMSNVLCEAMLCECVPVGSNVTFIPEIIGDSGYIIDHRNIEEMKDKVEAALKSNPSMGKLAKQRILENYSFEIREKALIKIIEELLRIKPG